MKKKDVFTLPLIGFGTYKATEQDGKAVILNALKAGYRYFDTAAFYFNEEDIGAALKESGIDRSEIFISSKVWRTNLGYESTVKSFEESLKKLNTDYLDLFLVHWPRKDSKSEWKQLLSETWKAMEYIYSTGKAKAIGVSNFLPHHLEAIKQMWTVKPFVNQLELHAGYMQEAACQYCRDNGILLQAWSPLGRARMLEEPVIVELAGKYNVSPAKLLLQFLVQQNISVIPKASTVERMQENLDIFSFEITEEDMYFLKCLPQMGWSGEHPDFVPEN
ncbi:MAG: aldo/keto reductase [Treponemataceae bacterium]|nr:aldo/keto reductase [Treponemataceae bacterium]